MSAALEKENPAEAGLPDQIGDAISGNPDYAAVASRAQLLAEALLSIGALDALLGQLARDLEALERLAGEVATC